MESSVAGQYLPPVCVEESRVRPLPSGGPVPPGPREEEKEETVPGVDRVLDG